MNTPATVASTATGIRDLLKELKTRFKVFDDHAPLAIGIDKQILLVLPDIDRKTLRAALGAHTRSLRYLKTIEKSTHRLDLEGKPSEEITEAQRNHAKEKLRERFRKEAERKKAQREAELEVQRHNEKLSRLVDKFGKRR